MIIIEDALASNESTLAMLPIDELLSTNGRLSLLAAKGYIVEEPK